MLIAVVPQSAPAKLLSATFRGTNLDLCWFLPCQAEVGELPLAQVECFSWCPHHGLDLFAHILTPPTLRLDFGSSAQCSAVGGGMNVLW